MNPVRFQGENPSVYYEFDRDSTPLGEGGMGRIYQGFRVDTSYGMQSVVAIKCIKPELCGNASIIQRAQRESSVQIDHENLIRMYGFLSGAEYNNFSGGYVPTYYIAMERLIGINLDEVLFKGLTADKTGVPISIAEDVYSQYSEDRARAVASVMIPVLAGVQALHDAGYIHRDLDPSNVMLTQDGKIKVIDFGISKKIDGSASGANLTQPGQFLGKVAYAAPELILGDLASQGPATDIYALGVMLFQMIAGYLPVSGTDKEVMDAHLRGKLDFSGIEDKALRAIIEKASDPDLQNRYTSCNEMSEDLQKWLAGEFEVSKKGSSEESLPAWIYVAAPVAGLAIGAALGFFV